MNFTSMEFLVFFPAVLLVYQKLSGRRRLLFLLAAGYLFYMNGVSWNGLLLFCSTAASWMAARRIERTEDEKVKKGWVAASVLCCIVSLAVWKQERFLVPGISFYLFQALSYVLDIYRGRSESEPDFACYALYVSFFPQLVAGPVERAGNLLPQLKKLEGLKAQNLLDGFWLVLRGFFKKLAVADYLAGFVETVYDAPGGAGGLAVVTAAFFFAVQIYCDFSGYTDIARGAARMLGIGLMENFDHPYRAENIQEFWRRWHISLTRWFTDYLYIPLGGSARGIFYTCRNTLIVFALSGLWHGFSWHYAVWGMLHGIYVTAYRILVHVSGKSGHNGRTGSGYYLVLRRHLVRLAVFGAVCFAWIFFRADSLADAGVLVRQILFHFMDDHPLYLRHLFHMQTADLFRIFLVLFCLYMLEKLPDTPGRIRTREQAGVAVLFAFYMVTASVLSWLALLAENGGNAFIYFSF